MTSSTALGRWGTTGWRLVGVLLAASMLFTVLATFSGLLVPLLLSFIVGILAVPLVDRLEAWNVPRALAAFAVVVGIVAVLVGAVWVAVEGLLSQAGVIRVAVVAAVEEMQTWLADRAVDIGAPGTLVDNAAEQGRRLLAGAALWVSTAFSGVLAFMAGSFIALFVLYCVLADWESIRRWLGAHLGVPSRVGEQVIQDAVDVVRRGFGALTITSLVTSSLIGLTMVVLGLPLALAVTVVTFVTSYVPYLGAIVSGAFGFLIALGTGGPHDALVLLISILVVQNVVQTVLGNRLTSKKLSLRPLPSILASVFGVAIAGLIGAILSTPALALAIAVRRRLVEHAAAVDPAAVDPVAADPAGPAPNRAEPQR